MTTEKLPPIVISHSQIKSITCEGLVYVDSDGGEHIVNFEDCYQNYLARRLSDEAFEYFLKHNPGMLDGDFEKYSARVKKFKCVADRNVLGLRFRDGKSESALPYFRFYTVPPTIIEFSTQGIKLGEVRTKLESECGWRTFDLT
ncbi:MAG: hypothetical protein RLP44_10200 [Aggregatilineales bacterium]